MNLNNQSPADLLPMAENPGKLKHGILPSTEMMAAQGFLMGRQAYKHAKRAAEQGFDPDTAAKYGASVAWFQVQFWFQATIMGVVALFAIGLSNVSAVFPIWAVGQLGFIAFFALRLAKVIATPPNKVLRYPFWRRTSTVYAAAWLWPVLVFVAAAGVWLTASPMVQGPTTAATPAAAAAENANSASGFCVPTSAIPHYHTCTKAEDAAMAAYNEGLQR